MLKLALNQWNLTWHHALIVDHAVSRTTGMAVLRLQLEYFTNCDAQK